MLTFFLFYLFTCVSEKVKKFLHNLLMLLWRPRCRYCTSLRAFDPTDLGVQQRPIFTQQMALLVYISSCSVLPSTSKLLSKSMTLCDRTGHCLISASLKDALDKFTKNGWIFKLVFTVSINPHIQPRYKKTNVMYTDLVKASRVRRSSKGSKSNAAIANIPSRINVLKEDVSENPESYIMVKSALLRKKAVNQLTRI